MKIEITNHAIKRTVERSWKVSNWIQAREYLIDKFSRLLKWEHLWWNNKKCYKIVNKQQDDGTYFITNWIHRFVYTEIWFDNYKIITYYIFNRIKKKKYVNSELKRIEKLFIK